MEIKIIINSLLEYLEIFHKGYNGLSYGRCFPEQHMYSCSFWNGIGGGDEIRMIYKEFPFELIKFENGSATDPIKKILK